MTIPDELVALQTAADEAHARLSGLDGAEWDAQWRAWGEAAERVQAAVTEHARETGANRYEVEAAVKRAARHTVAA